MASRGGLPVWDSQVLEGLNEFCRGIGPRILNPTFPKEFDEGAVGVVRILCQERETILVASASIKDD
jgi:hypothetical protein